MSSPLLSIPSAPAAANASASTASAARGRDAQSPTDAEGFGAALARSRQANDNKAAPAADEPQARRRGPASAAQHEEATPAELLAMAMLTPAFGATPLQHAAIQDGEADARTALDGAAATAGDVLGATDASANPADARSPAKAGAAADTTADTQAAQAGAADLQDKDARNAKAKAQTPDARLAPPAMPGTGAVQSQGAAGAPGAADGSPSATAAAAKAAADATALPLQAAKDAMPSDHEAQAQADTPALPPGAFNFKTALADAANASAATQPQPTARLSVPTPVGTEGWGADIGTQMIRMGADGHHVAELSLNPAGLGPLKVTLTMGDNQAQAMFVSAHESVRRALEAALPQLRDTLAGQGIQLGQASVDAGTPQQQQAFGQERTFEATARPAMHGVHQANAMEVEPARTAIRSRAGSGIDTFA